MKQYNPIPLEELLGELKPNEFLMMQRDQGLVIILSREAATHGDELADRAYQILPDGLYQQLDLKGIVGELVTMMEGALDTRHFLEDVLLTTYPGAVISAHARLKANPELAKKIKPAHGCYELTIPGTVEGEEEVRIILR